MSIARDGAKTVRYLVCRAQLLEALWSAKSLYADVAMREWPLWVHDDGSLDTECCALIRAHFPDAHLVSRREANQRVTPLLPPTCRAWRDRLVVFCKLFDFNLYAHGNPYLQVDTDILFFGPLDEIRQETKTFRYNEDPESAFSLAWPDSLVAERTGILPKRFNSGLVFVPPGLFDIERIERWLEALGEPGLLWATEQTILALEATCRGSRPLGPEYDVLERCWPKVTSEHYYWLSRRNMYRIGYPAVWKLISAQTDSHRSTQAFSPRAMSRE